VPITNDGASEGNENFTVTLGAPTGGAALGARTATVTITDDDAAPPPAPAPTPAGDGGGGCALNADDGAVDYGLPLLLLLAGSFYAFRRRVGK
ncbi:MAG: JDVT-CTERM domain-containing protein, partial [Pseudomonadota bacterium]|nr:JDVT-CTERM domain-containing protein [Pseudomonadota bacterium]